MTGSTNPSTDADLEDGIFAANGIRWSEARALLGHINTQKVSNLKSIGVMERISNKKQEMVEFEAPWYPRSRRPVKAGDPRHHPQPYIVVWCNSNKRCLHGMTDVYHKILKC